MDPTLIPDKHQEPLARLAVDSSLKDQIRAYYPQHSPRALAELEEYIGSESTKLPLHPLIQPLPGLPYRFQQPATAQEAAATAFLALQDQMLKDIVDVYQTLQVATEKHKQAGETHHFWETEPLRMQARMEMRKELANAGGIASYPKSLARKLSGRDQG